MLKHSRFAIYVWGVLAYNLAVIVWGAYVRATGSGAGCGSHWPLCNGEVIPRSAQIETMIEFSHRLTSGLALLLVVGLFIWAFRAYPRGDRLRLGATLSLVFMLSEALIGAGLVLFELVAHNDSLARVLSLALHLMNTFFLLAALTITGWWASGGPPVRLRGQGAISWMLALALLGVLAVGMTGAVTALGDTLFPSASLTEGIRQDFNPTAHFLIRLRVFHPILAVAVGFYTILIAALVSALRRTPMTNRFARALAVLFVLQLSAGALNLVLLAPVWLQMVHLLLADSVWIALMLLTVSACAEASPQVEPASVPSTWSRPAREELATNQGMVD